MKQAIFIGIVLGILAAGFIGFVNLINTSSAQWDRDERTFREECAAVNGKAVWNYKNWECLK
jgi:xanthine/uracil permease